jgi:protease PrsW
MVQANISIPKKTHRLAWGKVFLTGLGLYIVSLVVMIFTSNPNLFPTVMLVGNFLIPVVYVAFFYERREMSSLSMPSLFSTFIYGGLLGVLAASILEPIFIRSMDPLSVVLIGVIEEGVKILGVIFIIRQIKNLSEMDGLILGAAAGMGFAALESMGYTFTVFLMSNGSMTDTVFVTLLCGILSPIGHGTWTAILASVLFRERKENHFHLNWKVIGAFIFVALMHSAWDGLPGILAFISSSIALAIPQGIVGIIGFFVLWLCWRDARRQQHLHLTTPIEEPVVDQQILRGQ